MDFSLSFSFERVIFASDHDIANKPVIVSTGSILSLSDLFEDPQLCLCNAFRNRPRSNIPVRFRVLRSDKGASRAGPLGDTDSRMCVRGSCLDIDDFEEYTDACMYMY